MRGLADFVLVKRLEHGDVMSIVRHVAEKYPSKFEIIVPKKVTKKVSKPKASLLKKED